MRTDLWVVIIGSPPWHFGPLGFEEAHVLAHEHGGKAWPLWSTTDTYAFTQRPALEMATKGEPA